MWLLDGVWIGWLDLLTPYTHHSELQANRASPLIPTLYSSLLQTLMSSIYFSLHCPFLATDFNKGSLTVNNELHPPNITSKLFSSQPGFQFHWTALNNSDASIQLLCSRAHIPATQLIPCHFFSIIFDCHPQRLPEFSSSTPKLVYWQASVSKLNSLDLWVWVLCYDRRSVGQSVLV
jgi:hypothetical protein